MPWGTTYFQKRKVLRVLTTMSLWSGTDWHRWVPCPTVIFGHIFNLFNRKCSSSNAFWRWCFVCQNKLIHNQTHWSKLKHVICAGFWVTSLRLDEYNIFSCLLICFEESIDDLLSRSKIMKQTIITTQTSEHSYYSKMKSTSISSCIFK